MSINLLNLAYFSPTGTTRKILESIATGIAPAMTEFTDLSVAGSELCFEQNQPDLAVIGMPTYASRIPPEAANLFKRLNGMEFLLFLWRYTAIINLATFCLK